MAATLENIIKCVVTKMIETTYPHLVQPGVLYGRVTTAAQVDTYTLSQLIIHNDETGVSFPGHITANWYEYTLSVTDRFGNILDSYPIIPGIRSRQQFEVGCIVAFALPYGELAPVIIGEVKL